MSDNHINSKNFSGDYKCENEREKNCKKCQNKSNPINESNNKIKENNFPKEKLIKLNLVQSYDKNTNESSFKEIKKISNKNQQNNKSNSNQTNSNDSDNYKNNFNKNSTSQLITTSNSIHFQSCENNSKFTSKQNKQSYYIPKNEINLGLESINYKDENLNSNYNNTLDNSKESKNFQNNKKIIEHQTKFEFINKKRNQYNSQNEKNDISNIRNDLCPDIELEFKDNKNNIQMNNDEFPKKRLNKEEIIDDLRFNLLKNNLEEKKNCNDKTVENLISKEILFYQLSRLYTSRDDKLIKSYIIKKINELIVEDDVFENLLLLSKIQILKDKKINKNKLKRKNLRKLIELISNDRFFHLKLSNYLDSDSSTSEDKSNPPEFPKSEKLKIVKDSIDKFLEFLRLNGFHILKDICDLNNQNGNNENEYQLKKSMNKNNTPPLNHMNDEINYFNYNEIEDERNFLKKNNQNVNFLQNNVINLESYIKENFSKNNFRNSDNFVNNLIFDNIENNNNCENNINYNVGCKEIRDKNNNQSSSMFDINNNIYKFNTYINNNNIDKNILKIQNKKDDFINMKKKKYSKDKTEIDLSLQNESKSKLKKNKNYQDEIEESKSIKNIQNIIIDKNSNEDLNLNESSAGEVNIENNTNKKSQSEIKATGSIRNNSSSSKRLTNSKARRAWLCPHIHKLNYARGKCQNCYSNFYHKSNK